MPDAWRALGDHLTALGDAPGADAAYAQHIRYSTRDPRLMEAARRSARTASPSPRRMLRAHLKQHPTDVAAIRMLAEVAARLGRYADAEVLLERALELAPSFAPARHNYAFVLHRPGKAEQALVEVDRAARARPAQSGLSQSQGRHPGPHRRRRAGRSICTTAVTARVSEPPQGLDELRPCAEDRRPTGRVHRRLPPQPRARAAPRRGMVEPREPEDVQLQRRRSRERCSAQLAAQRPDARRTASTSISRSARRSRTRGSTRRRSSTTTRAMRCAAS